MNRSYLDTFAEKLKTDCDNLHVEQDGLWFRCGITPDPKKHIPPKFIRKGTSLEKIKQLVYEDHNSRLPDDPII